MKIFEFLLCFTGAFHRIGQDRVETGSRCFQSSHHCTDRIRYHFRLIFQVRAGGIKAAVETVKIIDGLLTRLADFDAAGADLAFKYGNIQNGLLRNTGHALCLLFQTITNLLDAFERRRDFCLQLRAVLNKLIVDRAGMTGDLTRHCRNFLSLTAQDRADMLGRFTGLVARLVQVGHAAA